MVLIKREIFTNRAQSLAHVISSFSAKKEAFQNKEFSRLKCQLKQKKIDTACSVKIFQVSVDQGMGK